MLINKHRNNFKSFQMLLFNKNNNNCNNNIMKCTNNNANNSSSYFSKMFVNKENNNKKTNTKTNSCFTPRTSLQSSSSSTSSSTTVLSSTSKWIHKQQQHQSTTVSNQRKHHISSLSSFLLLHSSRQRNLLIGLILTILSIQNVNCADLAISIPNNQGMDDAYYRLDYSPPYGYPEPNTTIASNEIGDEIQFSRALPGTKYNFWLYYTNFTHHDWLTWTVSITTAPDPPSNLSVQVRSSKNAIIQWSPPTQGNYTAFKIKVLGLSEASSSYNRVFHVNDSTFQHSAKELTPGATYQVQAYTIYDGKESVAYTSRNFTTSKSRQPNATKRPNKCFF